MCRTSKQTQRTIEHIRIDISGNIVCENANKSPVPLVHAVLRFSRAFGPSCNWNKYFI